MGELNLERSNVKFDLWERKLLDLSTRNSLLNLRIKGNSIPLFVPGCAKIEDYIAQEKNFSIIARGDEEEIEEEETSEETEAKEVPDAVKPVEETGAKEEPAPLEAMAAEAEKQEEKEETTEEAKPEENTEASSEDKPVQEPAPEAAAAKAPAKKSAAAKKAAPAKKPAKK